MTHDASASGDPVDPHQWGNRAGHPSHAAGHCGNEFGKADVWHAHSGHRLPRLNGSAAAAQSSLGPADCGQVHPRPVLSSRDARPWRYLNGASGSGAGLAPGLTWAGDLGSRCRPPPLGTVVAASPAAEHALQGLPRCSQLGLVHKRSQRGRCRRGADPHGSRRDRVHGAHKRNSATIDPRKCHSPRWYHRRSGRQARALRELLVEHVAEVSAMGHEEWCCRDRPRSERIPSKT
jgi:hypothetical protein